MELIIPTNGDWSRTKTSDWLTEQGMALFGERGVRGRHPTQTTTTLKTYMKYYGMLKDSNPRSWQVLRVLDASSGLGYGTQYGRNNGFNVTDVEPYPAVEYTRDGIKPKEVGRTPAGRPIYAYKTDTGLPEYYGADAYEQLVSDRREFDVILSNAVLNILPQDLRDAYVLTLKRILSPGGQLYVHTRSAADIHAMQYSRNPSNVCLDEHGTEWFLGRTRTYQKGFTIDELTGYLEDAFGGEYTVDRIGKSATTVLVNYLPERG